MNFSFDTQILASTFEYLPTCHSTSDIMLEGIKSGNVSEGHMVFTFDQTKGRGQRGSSWQVQPNKNLTFTLCMMPRCSLDAQFDFNILISVALREALQAYTTKEVKIKWPNDIYVYDSTWKKVAGMLIESQITGNVIKSSAVGIGINVNQEQFEITNATSLMLALGSPLDLVSVLEEVVITLEKYYLMQESSMAAIRENYTKNLLFYGEKAIFEDPRGVFEGHLLGVSPQGELMLHVEDRLERFEIKEVKFIF